MIKWAKATKTDLRLFESISILFTNHSYLLDFIFDPDAAKLKFNPEVILRGSVDLSSGEDLLIRIALDLWSGSGEAKIWELIEYLDDQNFDQVLKALSCLKPKHTHGWQGPVMR